MMAHENAKKNINEIRNVTPTFGSKSVCHNFPKSNNLPCLTSPICLFVSGRNKKVSNKARSVITPAIINGIPMPKPTVIAEIAGPKIKPKLKAAPIKPNAFALCSGLVESEMTAKATGIFPAVNPSRARAIKRKIAFGANAIRKNEPAVPSIEISSIGLRPYLSERRPIIGVEIN